MRISAYQPLIYGQHNQNKKATGCQWLLGIFGDLLKIPLSNSKYDGPEEKTPWNPTGNTRKNPCESTMPTIRQTRVSE
jgi:hypothetical protein